VNLNHINNRIIKLMKGPETFLLNRKILVKEYRLYTGWGEIAQGLNFKYLYKNHCKSCELLWAFYNIVSIKSLPCAKPPRLTVLNFKKNCLLLPSNPLSTNLWMSTRKINKTKNLLKNQYIF
jgi:hypothetical protein